MKTINLDSLIESASNLPQEAQQKYLELIGVEIRQGEMEIIGSLLKILKDHKLRNVDNFYVGFKIEQISKEFDLLRIGTESVINIELKRTSTEDRIKKQLIQNKYYLQVLGLPTHLFTFVFDSKKFYYLNNQNDLLETSVNSLVPLLNSQNIVAIDDINTIFKPNNYLVSPFNSTNKFINNEYFLTEHQSNIKNNIRTLFESVNVEFVSIKGKPGTGKTLLTYDLAKEHISRGLNVAIVHCGKLNDGHRELIQLGWNIYSIKSFYKNDYDFDVLVIDEAQRIDYMQFQHISNRVKQDNKKCILSYDPDQCFTIRELNRSIDELFHAETKGNNYFLTDKIRTNKEIASFIVTLFDLNKTSPLQKYKNIEVQYFHENESAKKYADNLSDKGWEVINFTNSIYYVVSYDELQPNGKLNSHDVIGQEFDNVAVFIDSHFYYDTQTKKLTSHSVVNGAYNMNLMLYQNLTRARSKLQLVIVNNPEMLRVVMDILESKTAIHA